ncbi:hypothetical protein I9X38_04825 [Bacillus mojavensis]|nr:hypothetical protein I9X38_04825 [Bacillus mojavensis]
MKRIYATKLGDPIEINALAEAFKDYSEERSYCALTSAKPNNGHTLAASGVVSLISLGTIPLDSCAKE